MAERLVAHRYIRSRSGYFRQRAGWCAEHYDFAWQFDDGSIECLHATSMEMGTSECRFVAGVLSLPRGTIKRHNKVSP